MKKRLFNKLCKQINNFSSHDWINDVNPVQLRFARKMNLPASYKRKHPFYGKTVRDD